MPHKHRRTNRPRKLVNRGLQHGRLVHPSSDRERAFAEAWERECQRRPGINYGHGILQDLMVVPDNHRPKRSPLFWLDGLRAAFVITPRDAVIVATVVQWLGSNCGWAFLETVVRRCGFRLVSEETLADTQREHRALREDNERLAQQLNRFEQLAREVAK